MGGRGVGRGGRVGGREVEREVGGWLGQTAKRDRGNSAPGGRLPGYQETGNLQVFS